MTDETSETWVDGSYESGADPASDTGPDSSTNSDGFDTGADEAPGAEMGQGAASTFEPEEDGPVDAEPT